MTSIMRLPRRRDFWLYPLIVRTGVNDQVTFTEGATDYTVTIAQGVYYPHAQNNSSYPGLYYAIEQAIGATAASNGYAFEVATPLQSSEQDRAGIVITDAVGAWSLKFTSSQAMPQAWFGLPSDVDTFAAVLDANTSLYNVASHYRVEGVLRTFTRGSNAEQGVASIKRSMPESELAESHEQPTGRFTLEWDTYDVAEFFYEYVPTAHVMTDDAGTLTDYATLEAQLATGDNLSTWQKFWSQYSRGLTLLLVPDSDDWDLRIDRSDIEVTAHVRYGQSTKMSDIVTRRAVAGEAWDIRFRTYITGTV
jgi:hypothetical protein